MHDNAAAEPVGTLVDHEETRNVDHIENTTQFHFKDPYFPDEKHQSRSPTLRLPANVEGHGVIRHVPKAATSNRRARTAQILQTTSECKFHANSK